MAVANSIYIITAIYDLIITGKFRLPTFMLWLGISAVSYVVYVRFTRT